MESIKLNDKYKIILDTSKDNFTFECLRYGEKWRDLVGDNLILSMFHRIRELEEELKQYKGNVIDKETHK